MNSNTQTDEAQNAEVASVRTYLLTFGALMVLTFLTVFVSRGVELHALSLPVALVIAFTKFLVVLLIFMHVWGESKIIVLMLIATTFFISLFFGMTVIDTHTRGIGNPMETMQYYREINEMPVINTIEEARELDAARKGKAIEAAQ